MNLYYVNYTVPVGKEKHDSCAFICSDIRSVIKKAEKYGGESNSFEIYAEHKLSKDWLNESKD